MFVTVFELFFQLEIVRTFYLFVFYYCILLKLCFACAEIIIFLNLTTGDDDDDDTDAQGAI